MMIIVTLRHCTLATILLCLAAAATAADTLTVATFNADFLTRLKIEKKIVLPKEERKRWKEPAFRDKKFADATKYVAQYIAKHVRTDILVLTEVGDQDDVAQLVGELTRNDVQFPHFAVCDCKDHNTKQHVAVLSRFPLLNVQQSLPGREGYLTEPDDPETEVRTGISKGMEVGFKAADKTFRLYAVHFSSESGGYERDAQRVAQASILRRLMLPALNAGEHVIVAGDLNDRRGDPALRRVRGLDDIWPDLVQTGHHRYFDNEGERWTYEFRGQREQIDHILLSQSIVATVKRRKGIRATTGPSPGKEVSDHRPLIVTLTFE